MIPKREGIYLASHTLTHSHTGWAVVVGFEGNKFAKMKKKDDRG